METKQTITFGKCGICVDDNVHVEKSKHGVPLCERCAETILLTEKLVKLGKLPIGIALELKSIASDYEMGFVDTRQLHD